MTVGSTPERVTLSGHWAVKQLFGRIIDCQEKHGTDTAIEWEGLPHTAQHHYLRAHVVAAPSDSSSTGGEQ